MPSFTTLTAALALAGSVVATPVDLRKREFSIEQVARKTYLKNGPATIAKTFRKFGKTVPEYILKAAEIGPSDSDLSIEAVDGQNGTAPAAPGDEYDSLYLTPVMLGTKQVHLDFDTGSSDL